MFFFHKDGNRDNAYHWHRNCRLVPAGVQSNPDWMMSNLAPENRGECSSCRRLNGEPERRAPAPDQQKNSQETVPAIPGIRRRERPIR
jgi:hypothetical protein